MRIILKLLILLAFALPLQAQQAPGARSGEEMVDRVIALVGDTVLLQSDVQGELEQLQVAGQLPNDPIAIEGAFRRILADKVNDLVILTAAKQAGLAVSDDQVAPDADQEIRGVVQRFGSEGAFMSALAASGISREQYRQSLIDQLRDRQLAQMFLGTRLASQAAPLIDEDEIRAFFEEQRSALGSRPATVSFRQVVVAPLPSPEARQEAIARATEVLDELRTGADFEVLARRFSQDPGTAEHGGDLGWFRAGRMVPEFERAAFGLRPGQTSDIVETEFGLHIIRVDRARGAERQARHILIQPEITEGDVGVARERADSVAQALRSGAQFATLSDRYNTTEDAVPTATRIPIERLPPEYGEALAAAPVGELVGPLRMEDPRGARWAVLQLTERTEAGEYTLDDVRQEIRERLEQQKMVEQLMVELREQVYVRLL